VAPQECPRFWREVAPFGVDAPVVEHSAPLVDRAVEERLLLGAQPGRREAKEFPPIGVAREEVALPPDVAGFEGLALGGREGRQVLLRPVE
jgi:hypothetical protein